MLEFIEISFNIFSDPILHLISSVSNKLINTSKPPTSRIATWHVSEKFLFYRGVGLIRTMEIVKKSSELARSSELAQPYGFKSFDLKNEFLLRRANYLSHTRPNILLSIR